jgi:hypothetical protein
MAAMNTNWPWLSLLALGAFHGLNPAMGWLFACAPSSTPWVRSLSVTLSPSAWPRLRSARSGS